MNQPHNLEFVPVENLIPYARNSRTHSDAQVAQIAASIKEFGFTNPVLIDEADGIIAGHGRLLAARKLGMAEVPCLRLGYLSEIQKRAYIIADNKLALNSGWDEDLLMLEIEDLRNMGVDIDLLAFEPSEIQGNKVDYSVLEDEDVDGEVDDMAKGVKKAIQIEFDIDDYPEAEKLIKWWREQGAYVGGLILGHLRKEKNRA